MSRKNIEVILWLVDCITFDMFYLCVNQNSWGEDVTKDTRSMSHLNERTCQQGIPQPAAVVTTVSSSTRVKERRVKGDLNKVKADETKWQQILLGRGEIIVARQYKGWGRESQWYPGLASSLPASASAASAGASLHSTEWKQGQTRLRQKFGSSSNFFWCFPPRMETKSGEARSPFRSLGTIRDFRGLVPATATKSLQGDIPRLSSWFESCAAYKGGFLLRRMD